MGQLYRGNDTSFGPGLSMRRIDGPAEAKEAAASPSRDRIFVCKPAQAAEEEGCARQIATALARRAYRGTATANNVDALMSSTAAKLAALRRAEQLALNEHVV